MYRLKLISFAAVVVCCILSTDPMAQDKAAILGQQKELERIRNDVESGKKKLDSLQKAGVRVSQQISEYDQKISSDRRVIARLNKEYQDLVASIESVSDGLAERESLLDRAQRRYLGNIRQFYRSTSGQSNFLSFDPNSGLEQHRRVIYLAALASFESANVAEATSLLEEAVSQLDELSGRSKVVSGLKKTRETSVAVERSRRSQEQKSLDQLQRRSREESDRILTLQEAAQEMEAIIVRLESERTRSTRPGEDSYSSTVFTSLKGQLPPPIVGQVIVKFGTLVDPVTRLKSFSPGITIKGRSTVAVRAIASGTVAYAGELRGYGRFVIINHDGQYYTTYAGLGGVTVAHGQYVQAQAKVGETGPDGIVKLEIRRGRESLDPIEWIRIETL